MAEIHPAARDLLNSPALAHMVTLNGDGSPQVTCVWVGTDGDEIVSGHLFKNKKVRNLEADPRVSMSLEGDGVNEMDLREYLVVHGQARIQEGGAPELLQELAHVYLGQEVKFPPMDDPPAGFVLRITPERFGGVGPWAS